MKILFTKSEYRALLDMIYMAEWMLTAYQDEDDPAQDKYDHLAQKIYSHAREMGWETLVETVPEDNSYSPTLAYEKSGIHDLIQDYDSGTFWEELVDRLTERDVAGKLPAEERKKLSLAAYDALADPIAEAYSREFDANGIDRLKLADS